MTPNLKLNCYAAWLVLAALSFVTSPALASGPLAGNQAHGLMLAADSTVCAVGENANGQLGDGTAVDRLSPVTAARIAGATGISTGWFHSLAVLADGTVWSWGYNNEGELGSGTTNSTPTPMPVPGLTGIVAVAAGQYHSLALKNDGTVWAWGYNANGRLGDGTGTQRLTPVQAIGLTGVMAIAAGQSHSMALKTDGTVWTWGDNSSGQLGNGTFTQSLTATQVTGLTGVASITAGGSHSMALKTDGTVWSWGYGAFGQLGNGNTAYQPTIVGASGLTGVIAIAGGLEHSLAVKNDGTVWAWGRNDSGQLGDGTVTGRLTPVQVSGLTGGTAVAVAAGAAYSRILRSDGKVFAWGNNAHGELGNGTTASSIVPVLSAACASGMFMPPGTSPFVSRLSANQNHSLAVKSDGSVWGWGENAQGQLGDGTNIGRSSPVQATGIAGATGVSTGWYHSLAVLANGTVWSWGLNNEGELGGGNTLARSTPLQVPALGGIISVAAGQYHSLALKSDGTVWAWGYNGNGRLGDGTGTQRLSPVQAIGLTGVIAIAAGQSHSMALKSDGTLWTWGDNSSGQLGNGSFTQSLTAVQVSGLTGVVSIAAGASHSMALKSDGTVWTWGYGAFGQLGNGSTSYQTEITRASGLTGIVAIAGGVEHSLALKNDGTVWAWGRNDSGQLGDGSITNRTAPVQVNVLSSGLAIAAGAVHSLAIQSDGSVWAWGTNAAGQFGAALPATSTVPVLTVSRFIILAPPVLSIDAPAQNAVLSGTVTVSGWALDVAATIGNVVVKVDGTVVGNATYGTNRPDVCAALPGRPGCPNVGFTFALNTAVLSAGAHTITVTATDTESVPQSSSASVGVTVSNTPPLLSIDAPLAGAALSGTVTVSGWALDSAATIGSVVVKVDGTAVGNATYGTSRPDVCAVFPGRPGCPNVGFTFALNASGLSSGAHTITVTATDTEGVPQSTSASVAVTVSSAPPLVSIDAPSVGSAISGTVTVSGWALDNVSAVGGVTVKVDGTAVGSAVYGSARPDVCVVLPGRPGCPNVGFTFALNTSGLSAGAHTITVTATDTDGVPDMGSASVAVTVSSSSPPLVFIDAPAAGSTISGTVAVSGWAIDNASGVGTPLGSVVVKVDGAAVGNAIYGSSRPDVCTALPGRPGCPNVGYAFMLDTSRITPGTHTLTVSATDTDTTPDTGSATVTVTVGTAPLVFIDAPLAGSVVSGTVTVSGWAIDNAFTVGTAVSGVVVKVDGAVVGNATYGTSRPDVCAALPGRPGCPNVGFTFALNTSSLSAGTHTITVSAADSDATPDLGSATVSVTVAAPPAVYVDFPSPGAVVSGTVAVSGWAIDNSSPIGGVLIKVDGVAVGSATYGSARPDVCAALPGRPGCPNVGFTFSLNTAGLAPGLHMLTATATDSDSTPDAGSWTVAFQVGILPTVFIDAPLQGATVSGTVTVSGWAIDNASVVGTAINAVRVKVDGVLAGTAIYGVNRPDVCNAFQGRPGCPNVGFTFPLDTTTLSTGSHVITVSATDSDGAPDVGSASVTVMH